MFRDDSNGAKGGLKVGIHPVLLDGNIQNTILTPENRKRTASFSTKGVSLSQHQLLKPPAITEQNPFLDTAPAPKLEDSPFYDPRTKESRKTRGSRNLHLNESGKFIEEANQARRQARLEDLKKRIALHSHKAGIEDELDITSKSIGRDTIPNIEWWDLPFIKDHNDYGDENNWLIDGPQSIINSAIQHPIPVLPPYAKNQPSSHSVFLTKKVNYLKVDKLLIIF